MCVQEQLTRLQIVNCPECICNVDKTYLYIDTKQTKVVAPRGQKASQTMATSVCECLTIMAGISAASQKIPPVIVFKGKFHCLDRFQ